MTMRTSMSHENALRRQHRGGVRGTGRQQRRTGQRQRRRTGWVGGELPDTSQRRDCEATNLISRRLAARLEQLEASFLPAEEPLVIQVVYITQDGRSVDGPRYTLPGNPKPPGRDSWRWKRNRDSWR